MSNERHTDAELGGYGGPYFPDSLDGLQGEMDKLAFCGNWLEITAVLAGGLYRRRNFVTTSDGYEWFASLEFHHDGGSVALLFPWSRDQERRDGTSNDRSLAVYLRGGADETAAAEVVQGLTEAVRFQDSHLPSTAVARLCEHADHVNFWQPEE